MQTTEKNGNLHLALCGGKCCLIMSYSTGQKRWHTDSSKMIIVSVAPFLSMTVCTGFFLPHVLDTILYYAWGAHSIGSMDVSGPFAFFPRPPDEQPHRPPLLRASSNTTSRPLFWKCRRRRSGVLSFLVVNSLNEDFWTQVLTFPLASST